MRPHLVKWDAVRTVAYSKFSGGEYFWETWKIFSKREDGLPFPNCRKLLAYWREVNTATFFASYKEGEAALYAMLQLPSLFGTSEFGCNGNSLWKFALLVTTMSDNSISIALFEWYVVVNLSKNRFVSQMSGHAMYTMGATKYETYTSMTVKNIFQKLKTLLHIAS